MFLESGEIDNQVDWACQSFANDQVFLSSNLKLVQYLIALLALALPYSHLQRD